jgi:hypothetical protein
MKMINRAVLVVRPREPYLDWAASLDDDAPTAVESLQDCVSVYLVPEDPTGREETPPLEDFFTEIFERELEEWCTDESAWPERRDLETFELWFDVTGESIAASRGSSAP